MFYYGSPTLITTFMATVVKTAAFAAFFRLFGMAFSEVFAGWVPTMAIAIVLTLIISNLSASYQNSVKRMMAFSSVSHAGYMLFAIFVVCGASSSALLLYSVAYSLATVAVFGVLMAVQEQRGGDLIADFNGLARTNPMLALVMAIALSSLAGIPLTAGFFGKFFMFGIAISANFTWIIAIAVLMAAVGIYYYYRVIIAMYMREPSNTQAIQLSSVYQFVLILCALATVVLGVVPALVSNIL